MGTISGSTKSATTSSDSSVLFEPACQFDSDTKQHLVCGQKTVMHCHHYAVLYTQMATDAEHLDGPRHLVESAAESFYALLEEYIVSRRVNQTVDRLSIAEQYFAFVGLGRISFNCQLGEAEVTMARSHIDDGWLKRWGPRDKPVNFIGIGYIRAALAVVSDEKDWRDIHVTEERSIVCGAAQSVFHAVWRSDADGY